MNISNLIINIFDQNPATNPTAEPIYSQSGVTMGSVFNATYAI